MGVRERMRVVAGVDVVEVERLREALARHPRLAERLFTPSELAYASARVDPVPHLAARFAAKEAVGKLLGSGVSSWHDIEVERGGGAPTVRLRGRTALRAQAMGLGPIALSLSHTATMAVASAMALAPEA